MGVDILGAIILLPQAGIFSGKGRLVNKCGAAAWRLAPEDLWVCRWFEKSFRRLCPIIPG